MLPFIDAHHHLWDLQACHYPWLSATGKVRFFGDPTPIQKNYLVSDYLRDVDGIDIAQSIHIQVGVEESQSIEETRWVQSQADLLTAPKIAAGIVAFADLTDPHLPDLLLAHAKSENFRGVRQILGRHPVEDRETGSDHLLSDPAWVRGLTQLSKLDLSFDLQLIASQYEKVADILGKVPDLKLAICHFGSPWEQAPESFAHWRGAMQRFAAFPNVTFKFSGFSMFKPDWTLESIKPYVVEALSIFGPRRCMVGSNYPVDGLHRPFADIFHAIDRLTCDMNQEERESVFCGTARRFYRLA